MLDLVGHQGNQRRDDDGQPAERHGRELVAETLARARGHDADNVVPGQDVVDDFTLMGTEVRQAEGAGQEIVNRGQHAGFVGNVDGHKTVYGFLA